MITDPAMVVEVVDGAAGEPGVPEESGGEEAVGGSVEAFAEADVDVDVDVDEAPEVVVEPLGPSPPDEQPVSNRQPASTTPQKPAAIDGDRFTVDPGVVSALAAS